MGHGWRGVFAQAADSPAGGAAIGEVVLATAMAMGATFALLALVEAYRRGRARWLARAGEEVSRRAGLPDWSALPGLIAAAALVVALIGMYWDISLHIDDGRDPGPLANPAHYLILAGLFGVMAAGYVAMALPRERPSASALRLGRMQAPLGGVLVAACAAFALTGFPLDDGWHRLFGQDVTLWGPTHLMLIGGASLTLIGRAVLLVEGARAQPPTTRAGERGLWLQKAALMGGFLIGLSTFQAEFDFGIPQFALLFQPLLIAFAAATALVAARVWVGPGGALAAAVFFVVLRGLISLLVGPVLGEATPHLPLYLVEAGLVELVALRVATRRPIAFGLAAGGLVGTLGVAAEWGWSHLWMPLPWPAALLPTAALVALAGALAGGVLGGFIGTCLRPQPAARLSRARMASAPVALVVLAGLVALGLSTSTGSPARATVTLADAGSSGPRSVMADVAVDPPEAADDAAWVTATAWQGGALVVDRLRRVGPGRYRSTRPLPVHGSWKALIRLHSGRAIRAVPVYLPADRAIPAPAVPAPARVTRAFVSDKSILQRESRSGSSATTALAYAVVGGITLAIMGVLWWGLLRTAAPPGGGPRRQREARAGAVRAAPA